MTAFFNHLRRQRNITGDDKISNAKPFNDLLVRNIRTRCYEKKINAARWRYAHRLVSDKRQL